jgi:hypothetical protein
LREIILPQKNNIKPEEDLVERNPKTSRKNPLEYYADKLSSASTDVSLKAAELLKKSGISYLKNIKSNPLSTLLFTASSAIILNWWVLAGAYRNAPGIIMGEKVDGIAWKVPEDSLPKYIEPVVENYKIETFVYGYIPKKDKDGNYVINYDDFIQSERNFVDDRISKCKILDHINADNGLKAMVVKDTVENKIYLAVSGTSLGSLNEFKKDYPSALFSSAGSLTPQFKTLHKFACEARKKFGNIDCLTGHSLGAHLVTCLAPEFENTPVYVYDGPGVTKNLLDHLVDFYKKPLYKIKNILSKNTIGIIVNSNTYNTIGLLGINLTMIDPEVDNYNSFSPDPLKGHIHDPGEGLYSRASKKPGNFYQVVANAKENEEQLYNANTDRRSMAGFIVSSLLFLIPLTVRVTENLLKKAAKKAGSYIQESSKELAQGIKNGFSKGE